jgi:hypothetical protein|tara:strand:- start:836 stop:1300 length:465 start_codon:yes stop_codon:yes gene_type:complete
MKFILIFSLSILVATPAIGGGYDRKDFNYRSYKPGTDIGFYTNQPCDFINIDHVVSLKDAYQSGAASWSDSKKKTFSNDRANHVPSCGRVNSSKGSAVPKDFLRRSRDGKGIDYKIVRWCEYVTKYHTVKIKYALSFADNTKAIFNQCDLATPQ